MKQESVNHPLTLKKSQNPLLDVISSFLPVWQHSDRGHIPTLNTSDNDSPASILLAFISNASRLCCTQPHKDVLDIQGE